MLSLLSSDLWQVSLCVVEDNKVRHVPGVLSVNKLYVVFKPDKDTATSLDYHFLIACKDLRDCEKLSFGYFPEQ